MGRIIRRVAIALSIVGAAATLWQRRIEPPPRATRPEVSAIAARTVVRRQSESPTPGWYSVTPPFDHALLAASLIEPGSRIDVLLVPSFRPSASGGGDSTRIETVAHDVRVLSVGGVGHVQGGSGRGTRAVPLIVEVALLADRDRLIDASRTGDLRYMLRSRMEGVAAVSVGGRRR